ncbi:hypothetical protein JOE11_000107 [Robbsia andropogonis]|uniref:hypothetical protein n=1 Tax=Robbsia andropogonis TaxID=28092 RepID=UPI003D1DC582
MTAKQLSMVVFVGLALSSLASLPAARAATHETATAIRSAKHISAHTGQHQKSAMTLDDRRSNLIRDWCNGTLQNDAGDANYPPTRESIQSTRSRRAGRPIPGNYGAPVPGYENGCP